MIIRYNETRRRFEAESSYAERLTANPLLKSAGFAFDGNARCWHTAGYKAPKSQADQVLIAAKLGDYLDDAAKQLVGSAAVEKAQVEAQTKTAALDASRATDSTADVPKPEGLEYLPYQRAGVAYGMSRPNCLIADEMGLGKTIQAIGICNSDSSAKSILIVCPASLKINWLREFEKWDVKGLTVGIAESKTGVPNTQVVIVNFDILTKLSEQLRAREWDVLITDECHKVKNLKAQRTQELLGARTWMKETCSWRIDKVAIPARRRIFLTGTPIVNRPKELWPFILSLDPEGLGKYKSRYEKRYCGAHMGRFGWVSDGATNLSELQERLRATFMIRRLKSEVLKDLPAKRRQVIVLATDGVDGDILLREKTEYENVTLKGEKIGFTELAAARKAVAIAKLPFVIDHVTGLLEEVDKVVVMGHHHEVINGLAAAFGNAAVVVNGETPNEDRQAAVDRFQTDPTCRVFVGSILAAGVGLTLTAASTVVFAELDWVPGNVTQAEDRCHRIGQVNQVLVQHLVFDKSVDANVVGKIISKQAVITAALDTLAPVAARPEVGSPVILEAKAKAAKGALTFNQEPDLTPEQVTAVHSGLRLLAAVCDGAFAEDKHGFNKFDSQFGKDLAGRASLSPKQALAGQKLVRKYQRQLPQELIIAAGITPMEK